MSPGFAISAKIEADFIETIFNSSRAKKAFNALGILGTLKNLHVKYNILLSWVLLSKMLEKVVTLWSSLGRL